MNTTLYGAVRATSRALLAAGCLLGAMAAHATDPATSPFAADRYDYSVLPPKATASPARPAKAARPADCRAAATACQPSR
ncbi:hypothetical protein [Cupriavidus agavae]|uniref:Uncharacterized protein n=1 Tax=Cupriavidus agavae TaxID=1001822 RepID=A0A4Q7S044_9BURK|nr:hypothetical protein [Cupriavidus agavae]RZT39506.1 hypothetical protein EV147_2701 [Cupriavidus agavae]